MNWSQECKAVIPCLNEAANIAAVVTAVRGHLASVLVVDDGSTDGTAGIARGAGAEVVRTSGRRGKGAALRAGWLRAQEQGFRWVMMLDGDGQHAAQEIPAFERCAELTGARLVVGDRMGAAATMPKLRRFINWWMSKNLSKLTGVHLPDSQCGFRLAHVETLLSAVITARNFEIESEMLVQFAAMDQPIAFVPVSVIYKTRASNIDPLLDTWRWLRWRSRQPRRNRDEQLADTAETAKPVNAP